MYPLIAVFFQYIVLMVCTYCIFIKTDCFEPNVHSPANDIEISYDEGEVESATDCQKLCQSIVQCKYFVYWNEPPYYCFLKTEDARKSRSTMKKRIFGPKHCPIVPGLYFP